MSQPIAPTSATAGTGTTAKLGLATFTDSRTDVPAILNTMITNSATILDDAAIVVAAPATATSAGSPGQIAFDSTHFYVCIASNSWVRATLASW